MLAPNKNFIPLCPPPEVETTHLQLLQRRKPKTLVRNKTFLSLEGEILCLFPLWRGTKGEELS
jgi:hypothetical protein